MHRIVLFIVLLLIFSNATMFAQECRTSTYAELLAQRDPSFASSRASINAFTQQLIKKHQSTTISGSGIASQPQAVQSIVIPVVVHVIYNSVSQNISDEQILSELTVLNHDYMRHNADTNNTPNVFKPFAANCGLEFALAHKDPFGNSTSGIVRKQTNRIGFDINDDVKKTAAGGDDPWDATAYLNIWVCNLSSGILGYASLPGCNPNVDGVVIQYNAFGTTGNISAPFDKGRTATHEIGHWLNLLHTWGDSNCGDDQVDDTPPQKAANRGCPGEIKITCGDGPYGDMYMNYMDFTNDACMNLFTFGQRERMRALFEEGGPRHTFMNAANTTGATIISDSSITVPDSRRALEIYPNPVQTELFIDIPSDIHAGGRIEISDLMGRRISSIVITSAHQVVPVSGLKAGMYFVSVADGKNRFSKGFVKQ